MTTMKKCFLILFLFSLVFMKILPGKIIFDFENDTENWKSVFSNVKLYPTDKYSSSGNFSLCVDVTKMRNIIIFFEGPINLKPYDFLKFSIYNPEENGIDGEFFVYFKDDEWNWFETEKIQIKKGEEKKVILDLRENSNFWKSISHFKVFDNYVKENLKEIGIIIWFAEDYTGKIFFDSFEVIEKEKEKGIYLYNFRENKKTVKKFEKFEIIFELSLTYENPFSPEPVIKGVFFSPTGKKYEIPAFLFHDYLRCLFAEGEKLIPYGKSEWKIRFTPEEKGIYNYKIIYDDKGKQIEIYSDNFEVVESEKNGFINWDKNDKYYLSFSNGKFFYPIGHTLRSPDDERSPYPYEFTYIKGLGTYAYENYFKKMVENGENYIRMWMGAWWVGIEWNHNYAPHYKNIGKYSLENSWKLDFVLDLAEKYGIFINLTLINHGQFSINPDAEWWDNPYNEINGGFLKTPDEFFINETAIEYFKKRLRYIVARWSYSPNIVFWELWNEVDLTGYYDTGKVRYWHKKIVPFLKEIDPYKRPITTHYCRRPDDPMVWIIPEIESIVGNAYDNLIVDSVRDFYEKRRYFGKPMMINEFGVGRDRYFLEDNLHGGIWASSMTPMFGVALFWWWPFIDYFDLYFHYKALSKFWENEDRRGKFLQVSNGKIYGKYVDFIGIQNSKEGYFWVFDKEIFNSRTKRTKSLKIDNAVLKLDNLEKGKYTVEFWDTYTGEVITKRELDNENILEIEIIPFERDIAIKVKKQ